MSNLLGDKIGKYFAIVVGLGIVYFGVASSSVWVLVVGIIIIAMFLEQIRKGE